MKSLSFLHFGVYFLTLWGHNNPSLLLGSSYQPTTISDDVDNFKFTGNIGPGEAIEAFPMSVLVTIFS